MCCLDLPGHESGRWFNFYKSNDYGKISENRQLISIHDKDQVDNTLIAADGSYKNPSIDRIYDIDSIDCTYIET